MVTASLIARSQNTAKAKGNEDSKNMLKKNKSSLQKVKITEKILSTSSFMPREWYINKLQEAIPLMTRRKDPNNIKANNLLKELSKEARHRNPPVTMVKFKIESITIFSIMIKWSSGKNFRILMNNIFLRKNPWDILVNHIFFDQVEVKLARIILDKFANQQQKCQCFKSFDCKNHYDYRTRVNWAFSLKQSLLKLFKLNKIFLKPW